jgi:hypothetical protein
MWEECDPDTATECHACAWVLNYLFEKYSTDYDTTLDVLFASIGSRAAT